MNIKTVQCITPDSGSEMKGGKSVQTPPPRLRLVEFFIFEILGDDLPRGRGGGGGLLPIHSLKWNPNDVLTTWKAISKGLASGFVYGSCALRQHYTSTVLRKNKNTVVEGGTVSHYYILVIRKFIDFLSLFRHSVWFSFSVKQFPSAEFGICNI